MDKPIQDMSTQELHDAYNADTQTASQVPEPVDAKAEPEPVEEIDPVKKAEEEARLEAERAEEAARIKAEKEKEEMAQFWANLRAEKKRRSEIAQKKREAAKRQYEQQEAEKLETKKRREAEYAKRLRRERERDPGVLTKEGYEEWERRKEYRRLHPTDKDKMERLKRGPAYKPKVPMPKEAKYWIKKADALPPPPEPKPEPKGEKKDCCTLCCTCKCGCGLFPEETSDGPDIKDAEKEKPKKEDPEGKDAAENIDSK